MAVRIRLRLRKGDKALETVALVNSGYEADSPQLLLPSNLARKLGLWPPQPEMIEAIFETAGGPLRVWIARKAIKVQAIAPDASSDEVETDAVVSVLADEPLISDKLAGALAIAVEDFAEGLWRFRWEPKERVRKSETRSH